MVKSKFVLTGPLKGASTTLGNSNTGYIFVEGEMELEVGSAEEMAAHARYLERNWQVLPAGDERLHDDNAPVLKSSATGGDDPNAIVPEGDKGDGVGGERNEKLARAVRSLDPTDDSLWTQGGKPQLNAVSKAYGSADITRTDVDTAVPGFNRESARANYGGTGGAARETIEPLQPTT